MTGSGRQSKVHIMRRAVVIAAILTGLYGSAATAVPPAKNTKTGTVTGTIGIEGVGPVIGGTVFFFSAAADPPPMPEKYWRAPDVRYRLDNNAQFSAVLPVGKYYLAAIERLSGEESYGPPRVGDHFILFKDRTGKPRQIAVKSHRVHNLGYLAITETFKYDVSAAGDRTAIEGIIRNDRGGPVDGVSVSAFTKRSITGKPPFVSEPSSKDGSYQLRLPAGGTYYLQATVEPLSTKGPVGTTGSGTAIILVTGETRTGIDIVVTGPAATAAQP